MEFINKGFSSILIIALMFILAFFLVNILPIILLIGVGFWGISYTVKKIKNLMKNKKGIFSDKLDNIEIIKDSDFRTNNIIDVDYTEVK